MMSDVTATTASSREEFGAMWRRQQPYWHAVFAIVWGAAVVVTLIDDPGPRGRGPTLVLLGVIALAVGALVDLVIAAVYLSVSRRHAREA